MARAYPQHDFDLKEGLLEELSGLAVSSGAADFTEKLGAAPAPSELSSFFEEYGRTVAGQVLAAGKKYKDRTAEMIEEVAQKTGMAFPGLPQRYIEIWLLGTRPQDVWRILENNTRKLTFQVENCSLYRLIKEKMPGETSLPCRQGCLATLKEIYQDLKLPVKVDLLEDMEQEKKCCFCSEYKG